MAEIKDTSRLITRLSAVLLRQRLVRFGAGLLAASAVLVAGWILLSVIAYVMVLPVWLKILLMALVAAPVLFLLVRRAASRLFEGDIDGVAVALEQRNPDLKGRLIAAVQFVRSVDLSRFSPELVRVTEEQALSRAGDIKFDEVVSFYPLWKTGRHLAVAAGLALVLLAVAPGFFGYAFEVYSHPTQKIAPPIAYQLTPVPGSVEWVKYEDITFGAALSGLRLPQKARIHYRLAGGSWQKTDIDLSTLPRTAVASGDSLVFGTTFRQVNRSFDYYIEAGDLRTDIQQIDVVDRPRVNGISLSIFYPEYTGRAPQTIDENNGSFSAVVGSRVNMKLETNLPVQKAELVLDDSSRVPLKVDGRTAETALQVERSRAYHIELLDHLRERNPDPIEYYITAVPDEYPSIDVVRPGFDVNLNDDMMLPLLVRIFDDYGFTSLVMKYRMTRQGRTSDETVAVLHFSDKIKTEGDIEFNWDLEPLNFMPGDFVTYHFEVADNDRVSGPKITKSRQYLARLPSLDEIISQSEQESTQRISNVEELTRAGKELSRRLKEATRKMESEMKASPTSEWDEQKELADIAQKNQEMLDRIDKLADDMDKSMEKLRENSLMSREILEKMEQIAKLFEEVATPEMREAQQRLMEMLQSMDRDKLQQAMEDFEMSQEELLQRLERTLALLKRMQAQAKMEAMIRKVEEILERQETANRETDSLAASELPRLSGAESENREALEQVRQETDNLEQLMKEGQMDQAKEAQDFLDALRNTDAPDDMQQMAESLEQQEKPEASESGQKAASKLAEMLDRMRQAQMAMNQNDTEQMKKEIQLAAQHCNRLSQDQEDAIRKVQTIDPQSVMMHEAAKTQKSLSDACSGLRKTVDRLGKSSPFIAAELQGLVNKATQNMNMAATELGQKQRSAMKYQSEAMFQLNRASNRLLESLDQLNQCQNGANCDKPMAQLESLCNKQNQLNQKTQGMCNKPGSGNPKPTPGDQAMREGLGRLAGEQGAIRKSLEQLDNEFGNSRQILGRLSDISSEMKEIEEALNNGEVGPETTERQLRVYSRMLEASRSLQRKDFTEQRRASTAVETPILVPRELPAGLADDRVDLEDRLRRFLGDHYPPQYEEQIKAYFRALLNANTQTPTAPAGAGE